jgi:hypothetical protein
MILLFDLVEMIEMLLEFNEFLFEVAHLVLLLLALNALVLAVLLFLYHVQVSLGALLLHFDFFLNLVFNLPLLELRFTDIAIL